MSCNIGYLDVPFEQVREYYLRVLAKSSVCRFLPMARFGIRENGMVVFDTMVCDNRMGGKNTGVAAESCRNCQLEAERQESVVAPKTAHNKRGTARKPRPKSAKRRLRTA